MSRDLIGFWAVSGISEDFVGFNGILEDFAGSLGILRGVALIEFVSKMYYIYVFMF
jgi:hypothetical protein